MAKISLVSGYRFHPSDAELVCYYLKRKVAGQLIQFDVISEIELYKFAPWDLPDKSHLQSKDLEWYFFCPQDKKYPNGSRRNRTTDIGYWKTTGKDRPVIYKSRAVGIKKTLVFHVGKGPQSKRTDWVMYEYRLDDKKLVGAGCIHDAYVLCKIFKKSGQGPNIGEQYSASFDEEDREGGAIVDNAFSLPSATSPNPSDDHPVLLESNYQQNVASGVCEMSSTPELPNADGMLLDQLPELPNGSQLHSEYAYNEICSSAVLNKSINGVSSVEIGTCGELEDMYPQVGIHNSLNYFNTINSEYVVHPMLSELGCEQYVKLNNICSSWESDPSDLLVLNDLFPQHLLVENLSSSNLNGMHVQGCGSVTPGELEDLCLQVGIHNNLNYSDTIGNEYVLQPMILEPGYEQYVEHNDICYLWESDPSDLAVSNDLFPQHLLAKNEQYVKYNDICYLWESDPSDLVVSNDLFPQHLLAKNSSSSSLNNMDAQGCGRIIPGELEDLCPQAGIHNNLNYSDTIDNEYILQPMLSEPDCEQYVEHNNICYLGESDPSDLALSNDLFPQHLPTKNSSSSSLNYMHAQSCCSVTPGAVNDPLPRETAMINDPSTMFL